MSRRHPDRDRVGGAAGTRGRTGPGESTLDQARDSSDARVRTLADRVAELEAELERHERRHREVVRRYERLLEQAHEDDSGAGDGDTADADACRDRGPLSRLRALLRR